MSNQAAIKLFDSKKIRTAWNETEEEWYFSVVDVIEVLTESPRPRKYWNALKTKLSEEGSELSQNMGQLKLLSEDGKMRLTDVANTEQLFRLIQSIPSPKAEPFKQWLENLRDNMTNKELVINMLAELSTKEISEVSNPETMMEHEDIAQRGGNIARDARLKLEAETGKEVVSPLSAKHVLEIDKK